MQNNSVADIVALFKQVFVLIGKSSFLRKDWAIAAISSNDHE
jgi:hypothetical protein